MTAKKQIGSLMAYMTLSGAMSQGNLYGENDEYIRKSIREQRESDRIENRKRSEIIRNVNNGLKPFDIEGVTIYAINRKNAIKKYSKLGI